MNLSAGTFNYEWQADWSKVEASDAHTHHGLTLMPDAFRRLIVGREPSFAPDCRVRLNGH